MFNGAHTALVTPFREREFDEPAFRKLIDAQFENGIAGIVPCGTTGESPTLSHDEHARVIEIAIDAAKGRGLVIAGTGSNSTREAIAMTQSAERAGADAALLVCPYYNKPSQVGLYEHFSHISEASPIPLILYDVPSRTGVSISNQTIFRLLEKYDNIIGIKDATGDIDKGLDLIKNSPKSFHVISGDDYSAVELVLNGGSGVISVVAGAFPREFSKIINFAKENKEQEAKQHFEKLKIVIDLLFQEGNPSGIKAMLSLMGFCENILRLPLTRVSNKLFDDINKKIKILDKI